MTAVTTPPAAPDTPTAPQPPPDWRRIATISFGVALGATVLFSMVLALALNHATITTFDRPVLGWFIDLRSPTLNGAARFATSLANSTLVHPVVLFTCLGLILSRRFALASFVLAATAGSAILTARAKDAVGRPRPPLVDHIGRGGGPAFPSGHAAQAMALALCLMIVVWCVWRSRRLTLLAIGAAVILAASVGTSRVYLGVHWPTDVIGGWLLAIAWVSALGGFYALAAGYRTRSLRSKVTTVATSVAAISPSSTK